jgi:hypothetical protein
VASADSGGKSLSQSLGLHVYPAQQQTASRQSADEYDCYNWSKTQSGYDPMTAAAQQSQPSSPPPDSSGRPAARGAAGGAAIGAIAGNAGAGAAAGAAAGLIRNNSNRRRADAQQQSADAQAKAVQQQNLDAFKKGMTACLEGKGYTVK